MAIVDGMMVTSVSLAQIERRIQELERVRGMKQAGSWLYACDTGQIERLREMRDRIRSGFAGVSGVTAPICGQALPKDVSDGTESAA